MSGFGRPSSSIVNTQTQDKYPAHKVSILIMYLYLLVFALTAIQELGTPHFHFNQIPNSNVERVFFSPSLLIGL
jgi:hypothetical protein